MNTPTTEGGNTAVQSPVSRAPVSFQDEQLVLVDADDQPVGHCDKAAAHRGKGLLHRAFSVFLFDGEQRVLIHRRSDSKPLWPGYWTNSCCSHPRRGETLNGAVHRRVREELGVPAEIQPVYRFEYQAAFADRGAEHELCHVYLARLGANSQVSVHGDEIAEWRWASMAEIDSLLDTRAEELTPWFQMEWHALRSLYRGDLDRFLASLESSRHVA